MIKYLTPIILLLSATGYADHNARDAVLSKPVLTHEALDFQHYWLSTRVSGSEVVWDGQTLKTPTGDVITPPRWFLSTLPNTPIAAILDTGSDVSVKQVDYDSVNWSKSKLYVYDLPDNAGSFEKRYFNLVYLIQGLDQAHISYVSHWPMRNESELIDYLDKVEPKQLENKVLRKVSLRYQAGIGSQVLEIDICKEKQARVIGYKLGNKGKKGELEALLVESETGMHFYITAGFYGADKRQPPEIGEYISYRYNGYSPEGRPLFVRLAPED